MVKIFLDYEVELELSASIFERIANSTFEHFGLKGDASLELFFVSKESIRQMNLSNREIDKVTDVLSFPFLTEIKEFSKKNYPLDFDSTTNTVLLGSIVVCDEVAREQAKEFCHSNERERAYLFLHGLLHLLGFDHISEAERFVMRQHEEEILTELGILRG